MSDIPDSEESPKAIHNRVAQLESQMQSQRLIIVCLAVVVAFVVFFVLVWLIPPLQFPVFAVLWPLGIIGVVIGFIRLIQICLDWLFSTSTDDTPATTDDSYAQ